MMASTFQSGTSYGAAVRDYLLVKARSVAPILMRGDTNLIVDLIDSIPRKWKYTSGVLRFHQADKPTAIQLEEIMTSFEEFMFAGKDRNTFEILWVEHLDKGAQEIHYVVPRIDLETLQDLNIAPPGYADQHKVWVEKINTAYGFKNPLMARATSKPKQEAHSRMTKRAAVYQDMTLQYEAGKIQSRADLVAELNKIGKVRSKNLNTKFIAVEFEGLENRIRFDGGIFARDFDFEKDRPTHADRASRTMQNYFENKPKPARDLHRFEEPIADPFGDQDVYLQDIEERYSSAFEYRRKRFEMLRAKSRYLKHAQDRVKARQSMPTQETTENVERIREARGRTRNRKSRIAELSRKATSTARACEQAIKSIGNYLQGTLSRCLEALRRKRDTAVFAADGIKYQEQVLQKSGIYQWTETLTEIIENIKKPPENQPQVFYVHKAEQMTALKPKLLGALERELKTTPHGYDTDIRKAAETMIDTQIDFAIKQISILNTNKNKSKSSHSKSKPKPPFSGMDL